MSFGPITVGELQQLLFFLKNGPSDSQLTAYSAGS